MDIMTDYSATACFEALEYAAAMVARGMCVENREEVIAVMARNIAMIPEILASGGYTTCALCGKEQKKTLQ